MRERAPRKMPELSSLKNIGKVTERWLNEAGVFTETELRRLGAVRTYRLIRGRERGATLNLLYALQGALTGVHWSRLPAAIKELLNRELERADRR